MLSRSLRIARIRRRRRAALALALLGTALACATRTVRPLLPPLTEVAAARLLDETAALAGSVRRYQAFVGVRGEGRRGRFSGRLLVVFARPAERGDPRAVAALRLELFAPVGGSRWTLVARPGQARLVVPAERAFAEGDELQEFTGPLLGVPVGLEAIAALLVGSGAPVTGEEEVRSRPPGGSVVLDGGTEVWWDSSEPGAQVRRVVTPRFEARYPDDYRRRGRQVPRRVQVFSDQVRATLTVEELEVNASLHPDSFDVRTPAGYRRAEIRELSRASRLPEQSSK